jgi:site-specific recombinase XerD
MIPLAPHLTAFLRDRLPRERGASPHTCDAYAYAFQLLLAFAAKRLRTRPSALAFEQLDVPLVLAFLDDLESTRGNSARTRNARLAAIRSFARFLEYRAPSCMQQIGGLLAIPMKRSTEKLVSYLTYDEMQAVLDAPDPCSRDGIRDRAMLHLAFATGLRVSELVGLRLDDVTLQPQPAIHVRGKGRRERALPLWKATAKALRAWLARRGDAACPELFLNARGAPFSRDGFEYILAKHVAVAAASVSSIRRKRVSPHVLRHSCAMHTLQATRDIREVALWLGHASVQTTEIYVRADPTVKLEVLNAAVPPTLRRGRFRAPDKLLASLHPPLPPP